MGRAMMIICAATLVGLGIVGLSTSKQGNLLTENSAEYANETTAKNAAHTAIQMAMQNINEDPNWIKNHASEADAWEDNINGADIKLYLDTLNNAYGNNYWQQDSLRMISEAKFAKDADGEPYEATVSSVYLKQPFSTLVPTMGAPLQLPTGYGDLTDNGNSYNISGNDTTCGVSKPPITVASDSVKDDIDSKGLNMDGEVEVDSTLDYEPTDELVKRLENSGNATTVTGNYDGELGTSDNPGVFFVDGNVKLTGKQKEGYGIMVVKNEAFMEYQNPDSTNTLSISGNFTFHGLVIFENADAFKSGGTPDIKGSVLVGDTNPDDGSNIDITISGNSSINYSCAGENYAKMAAANTVDQNKYTRVVTFEETGFSSK